MGGGYGGRSVPGVGRGWPAWALLVAVVVGALGLAPAPAGAQFPGARVTVQSLAPSITVVMDASPLTRPAPGGTFTFTVLVTNTTQAEVVTIVDLDDDTYGDLATRAGSTCGTLIGAVLAPGRTAAPCTFTGDFVGTSGDAQVNVVTAVVVDAHGIAAVATDDATVAITGVAPTIVGVEKTANPTTMPAPGGTFTFTVTVTNFGLDPVVVTSLTDDIYGDLATRLGSTCDALVGTALAPGVSSTCSFTGVFTGTAGSSETDIVTLVATGADGATGSDLDDATVTLTGTEGGVRYFPLSPTRIEDTRTGAGGLSGTLGPGATADVQITGRAGVPAGATAVVLNVTVTQPTAEGYLTLYPSGSARPLAANVNFTPGRTVPNLAVVKLGEGGRVAMFNPAGATHVIYDVAGYFFDAGSDFGRYQPLVPARIADTRLGLGGVRLGPGQSLEVQVAGRGGAPATGMSTAVLNVAVTNTTAESYLTVYPSNETRPLAANLNFTAGDTVSNRTMTKLSPSGRVTIYNNAGDADVIVDVGGTYTDQSVAGSAGAYTPLDPARILDTRSVLGPGPVPAGGTIDVPVAGLAGVPPTGARAVVLNVAVTQPAGLGYLTLYPSDSAQPLASDLNYAGGETRANLVVVQVGADGKVRLFSPAQAHVVVDVAGWFD